MDTLELLRLHITYEGHRGQWLAGRLLEEVLNRHLGTEPVHMSAQPPEQTGELTLDNCSSSSGTSVRKVSYSCAAITAPRAYDGK